MKRNIVLFSILVLTLTLFYGCCNGEAPYYAVQFEVQDVNGKNIVGTGKRYNPDSIKVYASTTQIPFQYSMANKDSVYYFYVPFEGLDAYNGSPYVIHYNFIEKDTFYLDILKKKLRCYTHYELKHFKTRMQDEDISNDRFVLIGKN